MLPCLLFLFFSAQKSTLDKQKSLDSLSSKSPHQSLEFPGSLLSTASGITESNPLSLSGELNLASLSSDSGVHTGKASEMSSSGDADTVHALKSPKQLPSSDSFNSSDKTLDLAMDNDEPAILGTDDLDENDKPRSNLSRTNSVRARANMFQALEEQRLKQPEKTEEKPIRKCIFIIFI